MHSKNVYEWREARLVEEGRPFLFNRVYGMAGAEPTAANGAC